MIGAIRYNKNLGDQAIFLRLRLFEQFFNFVTRLWVDVDDGVSTRLWMHECPDDGQHWSLYEVDLEYPEVANLIEEAVLSSTLDVIGWEVVNFQYTYKELSGKRIMTSPAQTGFEAEPKNTRFRGIAVTEFRVEKRSSDVRIVGKKSDPRLRDGR